MTGPPSTDTVFSSPVVGPLPAQNTIVDPSGENVGSLIYPLATSVPPMGRAVVSANGRMYSRSVAYTIFVPSGEIAANRLDVLICPSNVMENLATGGGVGVRRPLQMTPAASTAPVAMPMSRKRSATRRRTGAVAAVDGG